MKRKAYLMALLVTLAATTSTSAVTLYQGSTIKSGLKDTTGFFSSSSNFHGRIEHFVADGDFFVNAIELHTGAGWDPNLDLNVAGSFGDYSFGQAITGDTSFGFELASRAGSVNAAVPIGIYDFTIDILGGFSDTAMDNYGSWNYQLDVRENLMMDVSGAFEHAQVNRGETNRLNMTVTNTGLSDIRTDTWFIAGGAGSAAGAMDWNWVFDPGWWGVTMSPGQTETRPHSDYIPNATTPTGNYYEVGGIVAGYYVEDWHWKAFSQTPTFDVVPEPGSMLALGLGSLLLLKRRAK